jgi:hypothetical protein
MKRTANIATMPCRINHLKKMLASIKNQFDEIRIFANSYETIPRWMDKYHIAYGVDLTDNGKFYFLSKIKEPEYYFTLDDDIIYPPNYANDMVAKIKEHSTIVSHHGRIIMAKDVSYYGGHKFFHCANNQTEERLIDVAGTGVTAFSTEYFNPKKIWKSNDKCMSDVLFGLEAINQNKKITVLPHDVGYFKVMEVDTSIYKSHRYCESRQIELSNEIFSKKNNNITKLCL